jgi:hypothetical protein
LIPLPFEMIAFGQLQTRWKTDILDERRELMLAVLAVLVFQAAL